MSAINEHRLRADAVLAAVTASAGETPAPLRKAVMARATGGDQIEEPYDALARQIGDAAYRVTAAQVAAVRAATGTDKAAFEVIMAASIGAGLARWDAAVRIIEETRDATA